MSQVGRSVSDWYRGDPQKHWPFSRTEDLRVTSLGNCAYTLTCGCFDCTKQYPMVIPQGEPPPHFDEAGFPADDDCRLDALSYVVGPAIRPFACALCHASVTTQAYCWGCGLYVCDACDIHVPPQDDED